jgi:peptidoglycan LD-endopeptidase CwlK
MDRAIAGVLLLGFVLVALRFWWTAKGYTMGDSRNLDDLHPTVAAKARDFISRCKAHNVDLLVTCTLRSMATQAALYAQGRTTPGKRVTNAKPGQSFHNYGLALDVVPLRFGKPVWNTSDPVWQTVAACGEGAGLEWAGRWKSFKEMAHFQFTGGHPLAYFQGGGRL